MKSTDRPRVYDEEARRSKSLDGDAILDPIRQMDKVIPLVPVRFNVDLTNCLDLDLFRTRTNRRGVR